MKWPAWFLDDDNCAQLALCVLLPFAFVAFVVTLPVWLPICIGRGLYILWRDL